MCSEEEAVKASAEGWLQVASQKGSHVSLVKEGNANVLTVPLHRDLDRGLLWVLIRKAGLTLEEFCRLLE